IGERAPGRAVPTAEAVTVGGEAVGAEISPHVEQAVVGREGVDSGSERSPDAAPGAIVPAADVLTEGDAADFVPISPRVEIAVVDRDGIDLTVERAAGHSAPVRRANHPGAAHVVELGLDPVLVASHRGDPHLIDGPLKTEGAKSSSYIKRLGIKNSD